MKNTKKNTIIKYNLPYTVVDCDCGIFFDKIGGVFYFFASHLL